MNWKFDVEADAAYLHLSEGNVAQTVVLANNVNLDIDTDGRAIGLEVLAVSTTGLTAAVAGSPAR